MWSWLLLTCIFVALAFWLRIDLSPTRRRSVAYRLDAETEVPGAARPGVPGALPGAGVAIVCPGRNEAAMIRTTLPELCRQDYPDYRVVYIDDHSEDQTPEITADCQAKFSHLLVVRNEGSPPAGWVGKCWAIQRGIEALESWERQTGRRHEWLCFTDADIHWDPRCLRTALAQAQREQADVVGLFPRMEFGTAIERLTLATMAMALGLYIPFEKAMDPRHSETVIGGAFILVRRSWYERIGGHESVKGCMVDDVNLGRKLKAAGARFWLGATQTLLSARMYEGFADLWEGLTKNAYAGMEYRLWVFLMLSATVLVTCVLPPVYLMASLLWWLAGGGAWAGTALGLSALVVVLAMLPMAVVRRWLGLRWWYSWSLPVGSGFYLVLIVASVWRYYRGGNVWKGRAYGKTVCAAGRPRSA